MNDDGDCQEELNDTICPIGCKHCQTTGGVIKCMICDDFYNKSTITATECVANSVNTTNVISHCKYHDIRTNENLCYQCKDGRVASPAGIVCALPHQDYLKELAGCRLFKDDNKKCAEC